MIGSDIELNELGDKLAQLIDDRLGGITAPVRESLSGAADIYIKHAKQISQQKGIFDNKSEEKHFVDSWGKKRKKKYPGQIFVGNSRVVSDPTSDKVPLINIIEYGTSDKKNLHPRPIINDALEAAADEIFDYIASAVENSL